MNERDRLYLQHILGAIADIHAFVHGDEHNFMVDRKTQSAVIRQLEIIGEAVKQLSTELTGAAPDIPWRQIAGARDRLIHAYFQVDLAAVWIMVKQDLPPLHARVSHMLDTDAGHASP